MPLIRLSPAMNKFTLRKGVPVQWVINDKELNECNKAIVVPQYKLKINLHPGIQTVEFKPKESGVVPWICWMGMIPGTFVIIEGNGNEPNVNEIRAATPEDAKTKSEDRRWRHRLKKRLQELLAEFKK